MSKEETLKQKIIDLLDEKICIDPDDTVLLADDLYNLFSEQQ